MSLWDIYKAKKLGICTDSLFASIAAKKLDKDAWKKGFNKWDEEWENCIWNEGANGVKQANVKSLGCKNPIPIESNTTYYLRAPLGSFYVLWYDASMNLLSYKFATANNTFQSPANAKYMTFYSYNSYGTTYNNDICINVSGEHNGEYVPYDGE